MSRIDEQLRRQPTLFPLPSMPDDIPSDVCQLFEKLALEIARRGYERYSADAILHRIRWEYQIERGNREFVLNDHWTAPLARWFLKAHPELPKFFALRRSRHDENV